MTRSAALTIRIRRVARSRAHLDAEHDLGRILGLDGGLSRLGTAELLRILALQQPGSSRPVSGLGQGRLADGLQQLLFVLSFRFLNSSPNARCNLLLGLFSQRYSVASWMPTAMQMPLLCMPLAFRPHMTSINSSVSFGFK